MLEQSRRPLQPTTTHAAAFLFELPARIQSNAMQAWSFPLGRWFGVDVRMHAVCLLLLSVTAAAAAATGAQGSRGVALWLILLSAVLLREIARTLTALALGLELTSILVLPTGALLKFANPVTLPAAKELPLAVAGPIANTLAAAAIAGLCLAVSPSLTLFHQPQQAPLTLISVSYLLRSLVWANILLAALHLLPAVPLDAGRIFRAETQRTRGAATAIRAAGGLSRLLSLGLVLGGIAFGNIVLGLVGIFVMLAASLDRQSLLTEGAIDSIRVRDIMLENFDTLSGADTLEEALDRALHVTQDVFPVVRSGSLVGAVSRQEILAAIESGGDGYVQGMMTRVLSPAAPNDPVLAALRRTSGRGGAQLVPVVEDDRVIGIVTPQNLAQSTRLLGRLRNRRRPATAARDREHNTR